ncbi:MAG: hypothetical protein ACLP1D_04945 [Xanthobacteraceae bacterium]
MKPPRRTATDTGRMTKKDHRGEEHDADASSASGRTRDWTRIHHSPVFWIGIVLCLAAISIYVWSDDLAWRPRIR